MMYLITPEQHTALVEALRLIDSPMTVKEITSVGSALTMLRSMKPSEPCAWRTEESTNGVRVWLFRKTAVKYQDQPDALYAKEPT